MSEETSSVTPTEKPDAPHTGDLPDEPTTSILDETPDVDIAKYVAAQKSAAKRAKMILQFMVGVVIVAVPVAYLRMTGHLSRSSIASAVHSGSQETAGHNPSDFSLAKPSASPAVGQAPAPHTKKDPAIAKDLNDYVYRDLKAINPYERQALLAFASVTGKNFATSATTFSTVKSQVIPPYAQFVSRAEAIHPKTPQVQAIHRLFVMSAQLKMRAFKDTLAGENDSSGLWQFGVKGEFDGSGQFANEFKKQINQLADDQGVKMP